MSKREKRYSFSPLDNIKYRAQIVDDGTSRHIRGYGIVFNQKSKIITEYISEKCEVRTFYEVILPSALDNVLNNGFDVVMDKNHDFENIYARISSGTLTLTKDEIGIAYDFDAANEALGESALQMIRRGDYYESSFMFNIADGGDSWELDDETGLYTRTITNIETLYDMAICSYRGAYSNTSIENISQDNKERFFEYKKEDVEVAFRKLNELYTKREGDFPEWVYMIHHMHDPDDPDDMEELHHCPLFSEKEMKGEEYQTIHIDDPNSETILHGIESDDPNNISKLVYDHLNNEYAVETQNINEIDYAVITGPTKPLVHTDDEIEKKSIQSKRKFDEDFITRIYMKRNWNRKKSLNITK